MKSRIFTTRHARVTRNLVRAVIVLLMSMCAYSAWTVASRGRRLPHTREMNRDIRLVTQRGVDGLGHQLLGMYSCMLLPRLDKRWKYVQKRFLRTDPRHVQSRKAASLFRALQRNYAPRLSGSKVMEVDNCGGYIKQLCTEKNACKAAKLELSHQWLTNIDSLLQRVSVRQNILLHVRGGDSDNQLFGFDVYPSVLNLISKRMGLFDVDIFCESEADKALIQLALIPKLLQSQPELSVSFFVGGDPLESWIQMVQAKALVLAPSQFSVSASLVRKCVTFSIVERPVRGRYDDNTFPCVLLVGSEKRAVYYTPFHGATVDDCQELGMFTGESLSFHQAF